MFERIMQCRNEHYDCVPNFIENIEDFEKYLEVRNISVLDLNKYLVGEIFVATWSEGFKNGILALTK